MSEKPNIHPADPDKLRMLRNIIISTPVDVTPDMVRRGYIAYHNRVALGLAHDEWGMIKAVLEAALGGGD